jgi:DNA-binding transcriptional regulator LsrR (DeoR family)
MDQEYADLVAAADEWREALDFAEEKRDELAVEVTAAYEDGLSQRAIAEVTALHRATVKKMLTEAGY